MCSSESRVEYMKPLLLKAGIPAALSVGAYICARIVSKRSDTFMETLSNRLQRSSSQSFYNSLNSTISDCSESEDQGTESLQESNLVDKLLELETQLIDVKNKEWDLESRFLRYRNTRDKEMMLMEIRNMKMMQKARAESLLKEISSMEDENERLGGMVKEYMKLMNEVKGLKSENGLLRRKARKQGRRAKHRLRVIRERQNLCIEARDAELLSNQIEIEMRTNHIKELEDDICQLKEVVDHLQRDKIELYNKVYLAEKSASSNQMIQTSGVTKEDYEEILKELEQLKKTREVEAKELTYIKWSNACLRRKVLNYHEQQEHRKGEEIVELEGNNNNNGTEEAAGNHNEMHERSGTLVTDEDHEPCLGTGGQVHSKRKRLIQKLKKWVDGGGKMDEKLDKNDEMIKCFGRLSVSEDESVHARISCSSV